LRLQSAEVTAAKSRQGIVIQHRAWPPEHAFRSEEDYDGVVGMNE
jgi:chromosome transmission fidelity protein 18